jgi:hypothetical protein
MKAITLVAIIGLLGCEGPDASEPDGGAVLADAGFDQCTGLPPGPASPRSCGFDGERCAPDCTPITARRLDETCCESGEPVAIDCVRGLTVGALACVIDSGTGRAFLANAGPLPLDTWPRCPDEILDKLDAEACTGSPE